jgi:hydroxypyruvate isomerase
MSDNPTRLTRRDFVRSAALGSAALSLTPGGLTGGARKVQASPSGFKLKYAPGFGMFTQHAGKDLVDQIKFMHDQGFRAMFDNGLMNRAVEDQEAIAKETGKLNMTIGPFVAYADFKVKSFVTGDASVREMMAGKLQTAVEAARRTNAAWTLVVPGRYDESLDWDYQTANVVENLKWCAGVCEPAGLVIVLEPLNPVDHPGLFLTKMAQTYQITKAVGSPCVKIVDDIYHQQITEGNLIPNIDRCWDEIASFHIGDSPGRKEPGTGEINYRNVFGHIAAKGYEGVLCMEHGRKLQGKEGEKAVLEAYRAADDF